MLFPKGEALKEYECDIPAQHRRFPFVVRVLERREELSPTSVQYSCPGFLHEPPVERRSADVETDPTAPTQKETFRYSFGQNARTSKSDDI